MSLQTTIQQATVAISRVEGADKSRLNHTFKYIAASRTLVTLFPWRWLRGPRVRGISRSGSIERSVTPEYTPGMYVIGYTVL